MKTTSPTNQANEAFSQDGNPTYNNRRKDLDSSDDSKRASMKDATKLETYLFSEVNKKKVASSLSELLADTHVLYLKTQNFHWNVRGPSFLTLHPLFMKQYLDLALAIDLIAERIRSLGTSAPGTFREYLELSTIKEKRKNQTSSEMLEMLNKDQEQLILKIRKGVGLAQDCHDFTSADLLTERLQIHEKNVWILTSILNQDSSTH